MPRTEVVDEDDLETIEEYFLPDGVHRSEKGYAMNVKLLLPELLNTLQDRASGKATRKSDNRKYDSTLLPLMRRLRSILAKMKQLQS